MKTTRLICAASLVASTILASSAYATYDIFDRENFPDSSDVENITWANEDIQWALEDDTQRELRHIPNPRNAPPPVIEAKTCELHWPHEEVGLQVAFHSANNRGENGQYFHVTNQNEFDVKVIGADWARSITFQLNNTVLNWRHADSYEEAKEEDRRILTGYWRQEPFHSDQIAQTKPHPTFYDYPEALVLGYSLMDHHSPFLEEEIFQVPGGKNGFNFEMRMLPEEGAWEDSHYRLDVELFCLDGSLEEEKRKTGSSQDD